MGDYLRRPKFLDVGREVLYPSSTAGLRRGTVEVVAGHSAQVNGRWYALAELLEEAPEPLSSTFDGDFE